ncbi:hypothetical protein R6Q57_021642 [Mikania cordata]
MVIEPLQGFNKSTLRSWNSPCSSSGCSPASLAHGFGLQPFLESLVAVSYRKKWFIFLFLVTRMRHDQLNWLLINLDKVKTDENPKWCRNDPRPLIKANQWLIKVVYVYKIDVTLWQ